MAAYENVGGPPRGDWAKGLCNCWETLGGIKAFGMACCWPLCGPCLYSKISARSSMPGTSWEKLGDSPFKQWFRLTVRPDAARSRRGAAVCVALGACAGGRVRGGRVCAGRAACARECVCQSLTSAICPQLILVLVYWFASWGESMMTPDKPHFNAVANSDAELKDFKKMENLTEAAIVRAQSMMLTAIAGCVMLRYAYSCTSTHARASMCRSLLCATAVSLHPSGRQARSGGGRHLRVACFGSVQALLNTVL